MLHRIPPPLAASAAGGSVSSGTVVFSNSNGVSFGLNGSTLTASHNALTTARASTDAVGLNTAQTNVTWTVNSSGISLNAGGYAGTGFTSTTTAGTAIVGTHNTAGLSLGVPAYLTAGGFSAGVSTGGNTAGNTGVTGSRLVLVGNPNITLSQNTDANGATVTISGGAGAAGNTGFISAGGATASLGTVVFSNSNGLAFGVNGQTVTGSYTVPAQFSGGMSTAGNTAGDTGFVTGRLALVGSNNITLSGSTNAGSMTLTISGPTQTVESQSIGMSNLGNTSGTTGVASGGQVRFLFAGGNNVTLSQSLNGASGTITISAASQTVQTQGITGDQLSLGLSNLGNTQGNTTVQTGNRFVLVGTNGITLSQATGAGSTTISISGNAAQTGISGIQVSDTTYTSGTVTFRNANGVSFGSSGANGISASYTVPTVTSWTVSDSATSATVGRLAFTASNGLTLTLSTSNNGNHTVIGSYTVPTVTNSSLTVSDAATSGTLARLAFTNLNGVTLSLSTGAGGSHTIVGSHNALTSQSGQGASASNGSFAFQTLAFSNANNVTFGTSAGSIITASVAAPGAAAENNWFTLTGDAAGNVVGNSSASGSTIQLSAINLTLSGTNNSQIAISAPATSSLSATGWASISVNGSTISIGASTTANLYAVGNTFGTSSGTADIRTVSISGAGGVSVAASNSGWVISAPVNATLSEYDPFGFAVGTLLTNSTLGQNTLYFQPFDVPDDLNAYRLNLYVSVATGHSAANSTGRAGYTISAALYTRGTGASTDRISSFWSMTAGMSITQNSNTQVVATNLAGISNSTQVSTVGTSLSTSNASTYALNSIGGYRVIPLPVSSSLTPGRYWLAVANSTTQSNPGVVTLNCSVMQFTSGSNLIAFQHFGTSSSASNISFRNLYPGLGTYSATSGAFPGSVALSTDQIRAPLLNHTMVMFNVSGYTTATNIL